MDKYVLVRTIGRGHFGVVDLVKSKEDGKHYVVKQIDLHGLSEKERKEAFEEVISALCYPFTSVFPGWIAAAIEASLHCGLQGQLPCAQT